MLEAAVLVGMAILLGFLQATFACQRTACLVHHYRRMHSDQIFVVVAAAITVQLLSAYGHVEPSISAAAHRQGNVHSPGQLRTVLSCCPIVNARMFFWVRSMEVCEAWQCMPPSLTMS